MRRTWVVALVLGTACGSGEAEQGGSAAAGATPPSASGSPKHSGAVGDAIGGPPKAKPSEPEPELIEPLGEPMPAPEAARMGPVDLPRAPDLTAPAVPDRYPDGAWSIAGLRKDPEARWAEGDAGVELLVRVYVQEVYVPPPCLDAATCPPTKQPHLWAADTKDTRGHKRSMLVVGYSFSIPAWDAEAWKDMPTIDLRVGEQYLLTGKFRQFSDTGFADANGLLEFVAVKQLDPDGTMLDVFPPGAPWHPLSIARAEGERVLLEKTARKRK
jgi:hypothetical protein